MHTQMRRNTHRVIPKCTEIDTNIPYTHIHTAIQIQAHTRTHIRTFTQCHTHRCQVALPLLKMLTTVAVTSQDKRM